MVRVYLLFSLFSHRPKFVMISDCEFGVAKVVVTSINTDLDTEGLPIGFLGNFSSFSGELWGRQ